MPERRDWLDSTGRFMWGQHKGEYFGTVPADYLRWVLDTGGVSDVDEEILLTCLRRRGDDDG